MKYSHTNFHPTPILNISYRIYKAQCFKSHFFRELFLCEKNIIWNYKNFNVKNIFFKKFNLNCLLMVIRSNPVLFDAYWAWKVPTNHYFCYWTHRHPVVRRWIGSTFSVFKSYVRLLASPWLQWGLMKCDVFSQITLDLSAIIRYL